MMNAYHKIGTLALSITLALFLFGCDAMKGEQGPAGKEGPAGPAGAMGAPGAPGKNGADGKDAAMSGSQLTAQFLVGSDGARSFYGWHDKLTDYACDFRLASDDVLRCLPAVYTPANGGSTTVGYSDSKCTMPLLAIIQGSTFPAPSAPPKALTVPGGGNVPDQYLTTSGSMLAATTFYIGALCSLQNTNAGGQTFYLWTATEHPAADFVSGQVQ